MERERRHTIQKNVLGLQVPVDDLRPTRVEVREALADVYGPA